MAMLYLLAFFLSPLAVLLAGKPFQAVLNGVVYVLAWGSLLFGVGHLFWAIGVAHACFVIHGRNADRRTAVLAAAIRQSGPGRAEYYR